MITAQHVAQALHAIPGAYGGQAVALLGSGHTQADALEALAVGANQALTAAPLGLTVEGAAAFLATMAQESGTFRYLHEAGTSSYLRSKPYYPYIGRTFEQITWRSNYAAFGSWCTSLGLLDEPDAFADDPASLGDIRWAWLGGIWFWQANGIWPYANRGDFLATQRAVNLGNPNTTKTPAGITARRAWYAAWLTVGPDLIPDPIPTDPDTALPSERPIEMAAATNIYLNYAGKQALKPGDNEVTINDKGDKTLVSGPNKGVDLLATIDVRDATGTRVPVEAFFRVVSFKDKTPTTTISSRRATTSDQVSFKGSIAADKDKARSSRLRLVVHVPDDVTGLTLASVQISGWKL